MITIKHRVLKDFQLLTSDKKIVVLKAGSILDEYKYGSKSDFIKVDSVIVSANPDFFLLLDWKIELVNVIKSAKIPQPSVVAKKIIPFLEEMVIQSSSDNIQTSNNLEIEKIEEEYRQKVRKLHDLELEYESNNSRVSRKAKEMESELEFKSSRLLKREEELKEQIIELEAKQTEAKKKIREAQAQEEKVREYEVELKKKERELDNMSLLSEKDVESKQKELQDKIKSQLRELETKERDYNDKMDRMEEQERKLSAIQDKVDKDLSNLEEETSKKMDEMDRQFRKRESELMDKEVQYIEKIRNIKSRLESFEKVIPWAHLPSNIKSDFNLIIDSARQI